MRIEIKDVHEFNNCGSFMVVAGDKEYFTKWKVNNNKYEYNTDAPNDILEEVKKQFELPMDTDKDDSKFIKGRDYRTQAVTTKTCKEHTLQVLRRLVKQDTSEKWLEYTIDNGKSYRSKIFIKDGKEYVYPERFAMGFVSDDYNK